MAAIEIEHLSKEYGRGSRRRVALRDLCMAVQAGQIFGFIGPNGAGKSTTIKILVGLVLPTAGEAFILGAPCGTPDARKLLGFLPEAAAFPDLLTVGELLERHAALAGIAPASRKARCGEVLELVGVAERRDSRLRDLSKGLLQRVGLAQALVAKPPLLILDEPTSGLDPIAQRALKEIIVRLKAQGTTVFFSSHQLTEIELLCDAAGILDMGTLLACGSLEVLLSGSGRSRVRAVPSVALRDRLLARGWNVHLDKELIVEVEQERVRDVVATVLEGGDLISVEPIRATLEEAYFSLLTRVRSGSLEGVA